MISGEWWLLVDVQCLYICSSNARCLGLLLVATLTTHKLHLCQSPQTH